MPNLSCNFDDFLLCGVATAFAIADIVANGVVEEHCVLRDDGDVLAQRLNVEIAHVLPIDGDGATVAVVKAKQQLHKENHARVSD